MITTPTETLSVSIGGYDHPLRHTGLAGRFGCDPCFRCSHRPAEGERVYFTSYGDLFCYDCAHGRAIDRLARYGHETMSGRIIWP